MALSILGRKQQAKLATFGQNGRLIEWGQFQFSTTDATGNLPVNMRTVEMVQLTPIGTPNTDETVSWNDTTTADGTFTVPSTGVLSISRTGTKTSGLKVSYFIIGM